VSPGAAGSNLYLDVVVLAAYIAVIVAVLGIHALHSGTSRYGRLGTTGAVLTIAGYAIIGVVVVISMVQGQRSLLPVRLTGAGLVLVGSALLGVIIIFAKLLPWWCGVLLIVAFPIGHSRTRSSVLLRIYCLHCFGDLWALRCCLDVKESLSLLRHNPQRPADLEGVYAKASADRLLRPGVPADLVDLSTPQVLSAAWHPWSFDPASHRSADAGRPVRARNLARHGASSETPTGARKMPIDRHIAAEASVPSHMPRASSSEIESSIPM
jgi:hypothetical protein